MDGEGYRAFGIAVPCVAYSLCCCYLSLCPFDAASFANKTASGNAALSQELTGGKDASLEREWTQRAELDWRSSTGRRRSRILTEPTEQHDVGGLPAFVEDQ